MQFLETFCLGSDPSPATKPAVDLGQVISPHNESATWSIKGEKVFPILGRYKTEMNSESIWHIESDFAK